MEILIRAIRIKKLKYASRKKSNSHQFQKTYKVLKMTDIQIIKISEIKFQATKSKYKFLIFVKAKKNYHKLEEMVQELRYLLYFGSILTIPCGAQLTTQNDS